MTAPHPLATTLRNKRRQLRLTRAQVARRICAAPSTVANYETGHRTPDAHALTRWADALGYTLALIPKDIHG